MWLRAVHTKNCLIINHMQIHNRVCEWEIFFGGALNCVFLLCSRSTTYTVSLVNATPPNSSEADREKRRQHKTTPTKHKRHTCQIAPSVRPRCSYHHRHRSGSKRVPILKLADHIISRKLAGATSTPRPGNQWRHDDAVAAATRNANMRWTRLVVCRHRVARAIINRSTASHAYLETCTIVMSSMWLSYVVNFFVGYLNCYTFGAFACLFCKLFTVFFCYLFSTTHVLYLFRVFVYSAT